MKIITIGRSPSNDVNIDDTLVSRTHCQIIQDDNGGFRLIDTNSTNGTFVNGVKRHGEIRLSPSDIVVIGHTTLPWQNYFKGGNTQVGSINTNTATYSPPQAPLHIDYFPRQKPDNFLVWAILSTMFCCLPLGVVSIVYASKVNNLWSAGNYDEAIEAADKARSWFWWAFALGIISNIISAICMIPLL